MARVDEESLIKTGDLFVAARVKLAAQMKVRTNRLNLKSGLDVQLGRLVDIVQALHHRLLQNVLPERQVVSGNFQIGLVEGPPGQ